MKSAPQGGKISIHAPVKGATKAELPKHEIQIISIHAPVKGATVGIIHAPLLKIYFNPRSREGSDADRFAECGVFMEFQSTLP